MAPEMSRPGCRTARVRSAVLAAAGDALIELGPTGLDLSELARRAGVGKTTVYRRWGSVAAVLEDMVSDMVETSAPRADTGSLDGDLLANAELVRATLADPRQGRLLTALICAAVGDAGTARALRRFYDARTAAWEPCVTDATDRGELPEGTDPAAVVRAVSAPLYHLLLTRGALPDADDARRAAAVAAAAARSGAFVSAGARRTS
ncbi:TetR/AcrR family transcriptional regulator [Pseudonocardia sp. ICBG1293]|uniref:TetR/AcrR family transcriptional regulator n=1 Tax=Pseudonocardia sp. ICBG1293 TaxID=2844382 RepID=UPI001CCEB4CC|nr:TetR/AcrR family transcriptional regulator [Pseudonocardia sp. ICBG1293]